LYRLVVSLLNMSYAELADGLDILLMDY